MQLLWRVIRGVVIVYVSVVAIVFVFQRNLQYFPHQDLKEPEFYGASVFREVELKTVDGLALTSWYAAAKDGFDTIVHYHGNGGHIAYRLDRVMPLVEAGYGLLLTEYRGYGGNPGSPSEEGLYNDGRAALEFLRGHGKEDGEIVIMGESLGTGVAVKMAEETGAKALILESPFSSAVDIGQAAYFFLPARVLMWDRFESINYIADINAPLLILHGDKDQVVPHRFGKKLFDAAVDPKQMHTLKGAGHGDIVRFRSTNIELEFLANLPGN
jgi:uncharacterized protein